jgi:hypothetical protein
MSTAVTLLGLGAWQTPPRWTQGNWCWSANRPRVTERSSAGRGCRWGAGWNESGHGSRPTGDVVGQDCKEDSSDQGPCYETPKAGVVGQKQLPADLSVPAAERHQPV